MYSERHAKYNKQENEQQMILVLNVKIHLLIQHTYNEITIIKFSEFRNELSICSVNRFCQVKEVLRRDLG